MHRVAALLLVLFSLTASCVVVTQPIKASPTTIVVPDDYGTIQDAVDNASSGDTVFVRSGTYNESVSVNKSLSLIGEDKAKTMILGDWRLGGTVVLVSHDGVAVKGFTIQSIADNTHGVSIRGVHLLHVRRCIVSDCIFLRVGLGVWLYGASDNIIEDNFMDGQPVYPTVPINAASRFTLLGGFDGISLQDSSYNSILGNTVTRIYFSGIVLSNSVGNNLTGNYVKSDYVGVSVGFSDNNTITSNEISGNRYGIVQDSSSHNTIAGNIIRESATGIQINSSSCFNLVEKNTITYSRYCGVEIHYNASHNRILGNNITENKHGLELKFSSNNTLRDNNITGNNGAGIILVESSNNLIYQNNFVNNGLHVSNDGSINAWDAGGKGGNYWDNYTGTDIDNDGLGDSPYVIDEANRDNYPLIKIARIPEFKHEDTPVTPTELPSATPTPEPFPTMLVAAAAVAVAVVAGGLVVYFMKRKHS